MPLDPPPEYLAISSIVSYCFCPLSFYYRQVLGEEPRSPALEVGRARHRMRGWQGSADTAALYDIPLVSERLRLMGRADAVEMRWNVVYPVEFKATRTRALRPGFRQQLCAQGMALEEMTEAPVAFGYVEFLPSGQRELVMLDAALRAETETTVAAMHRLVASGEKPPGRSRPRCGPCSMRPVCLPEDLEAASQALSLEA
jgi:CRISPR-associated protein Cas4